MQKQYRDKPNLIRVSSAVQDGKLALPQVVRLGEVGVELRNVDEAGVELRDGDRGLVGGRQRWDGVEELELKIRNFFRAGSSNKNGLSKPTYKLN